MTYGGRSAAGLSLAIVLAALSVLVACNQGSPGEPSGTEQTSHRVGTTSGHPDTLVDHLFKAMPTPAPRRCGVTLRGGGDTAPPFTVERLQVVDFCFVSDSDADDLHVELTGPGGKERIDEPASISGEYTSPDVAPSRYSHVTGWNFRSDLPLGDHTYRAALSSDAGVIAQATGTFTVVPARSPTWERKPSSAARQQLNRLDLLFAGHPAGANIEIFLYGPVEETSSRRSYPFARTLPPVVVGSDGEAVYSWQPEPDVPPGRYAVWLSVGCGSVDSPSLCLTTVVERNG